MANEIANTQDLIALVAHNCEIPKTEAKRIIQATLQGINELVADKDKLLLREFGIFELRYRNRHRLPEGEYPLERVMAGEAFDELRHRVFAVGADEFGECGEQAGLCQAIAVDAVMPCFSNSCVRQLMAS